MDEAASPTRLGLLARPFVSGSAAADAALSAGSTVPSVAVPSVALPFVAARFELCFVSLVEAICPTYERRELCSLSPDAEDKTSTQISAA
jgi:hypothetical protein